MSPSSTRRSPLPPLDVARLDEFAVAYRAVFPRADQYRRFVAYLRGLLASGGRRNVEAIAARAAEVEPADEDLTQALQHFVSHSPWDVDRLLAVYRQAVTDPNAVWVVHDVAFPKKGRHSVGVQRQFARAAGRKLSCQVAVAVSQVGPRGWFPLAARLYLPAQWLRDNPETAARTVPDPYRRAATKAEIADELRAGLQAEGLSGMVVEADAERRVAEGRFEELKAELGLDHFEGRTWLGWHHHVGLVFVAHAFRATG